MLKKNLKIFFLFSFMFFSITPAFAQTTQKDEDRPILTIITPQEGEQILGLKVVVSFIVNNFVFTDFHKRTKDTVGEGHLHFWLDEKNPSLENAQEATRASEIILENVPAGDHELTLELVSNNHRSLKPPVLKTVHFKTLQTKTTAIVKEEEKENSLEKRKKVQSTALLFIAVGTLTTALTVFAAFFIIQTKKKY